MNNNAKYLGFLLALVVFGLPLAAAQGQSTVTYARIFEARNLRGKVVIANTRDPLDDVKVEECSSGWTSVVQSTRTDNTGHFALRRSVVKGLHYLRFSMPGMKTVTLRVRTLPLSPISEISIEMPVAD